MGEVVVDCTVAVAVYVASCKCMAPGTMQAVLAICIHVHEMYVSHSQLHETCSATYICIWQS